MIGSRSGRISEVVSLVERWTSWWISWTTRKALWLREKEGIVPEFVASYITLEESWIFRWMGWIGLVVLMRELAVLGDLFNVKFRRALFNCGKWHTSLHFFNALMYIDKYGPNECGTSEIGTKRDVQRFEFSALDPWRSSEMKIKYIGVWTNENFVWTKFVNVVLEWIYACWTSRESTVLGKKAISLHQWHWLGWIMLDVDPLLGYKGYIIFVHSRINWKKTLVTNHVC